MDAFLVRPVLSRLHWFDNRADSGRRLWSAYATRWWPGLGPDTGLDLYYIGYENDAAAFNQGAGREERHTVGGRFFGEAGSWSGDLELAVQLGDFGGAEILAWALVAALGYTAEPLPLQPHLEVRADVVSGDRDAGDRRLNTFNPLFPPTEYYGDIGLIGPANLMTLRPAVRLDLGAGSRSSRRAPFSRRPGRRGRCTSSGCKGPSRTSGAGGARRQ